MKKIGFFTIILILLLNTYTISYADDNSFVNNALDSVMQKIDIPAGYTEFNSKLGVEKDGVFAYFSWYGDLEESGGRINVTVDENCVITEFSQYFYGDFSGDRKLSDLDYSTAQKTACAFAARSCPECFDSVALFETDGRRHRNFEPYEFVFYRYENGLFCYQNYISVTVNAYNGAVSSMKLVWDECAIVRTSRPGISEDEAKVEMYENAPFYPEYAQKSDGTVYVRYGFDLCGNVCINAYNGDVFETYADEYDIAHKSLGMVFSDLHAGFDVSGDLYANRFMDFDDSYFLNFAQVCTDSLSDCVLFSYSDAMGNDKFIAVDSENKDIRYYFESSQIAEENKRYSKKQCKSVADSFCKQYEKKLYGYCAYVSGTAFKDSTGEIVYYYHYPRFLNGVCYSDNGILIGVSAASGKVVRVETAFDDLPELYYGELLPKDAAFEKYAENCGFSLQYIIAENSYRNKEMRAVYAPNPLYDVFLNAQTGVLIDSNGDEYFALKSGYSDIENDFSEEEINVLSECGVFDRTDKFRPDDFITLSEFLLYTARCIDCENYESIDEIADDLVSRGIVSYEELRSDGFVTTEKGIEYLITYLGYKDVAELKDTYKTAFVDEWQIDSELVGYAALAQGFKIFTGNVFSPKENLKRNVVAQILYNLISN